MRRYFLASVSLLAGVAALGLSAPPASAQPFNFSTGAPDGKVGTASRPGLGGKLEIESADDFVLSSPTQINSATFTGLIVPTGGVAPTIGDVVAEIYRVFPNDSVNPPSGKVPTRANSPSDNVFATRDAATAGQLSFTTLTLNPSFIASNSVLNGINPIPNQTTGGEGPIRGQEFQFTLNFTSPLVLPADHYFFVPQVQVTGGEFYWLSAPKPIVPPGTPFALDLQAWIRNGNLDPDWLRIGTDIVGGGPLAPVNESFSLSGVQVGVVPLPPAARTGALLLPLVALLVRGMRRRGIRYA